MKRATNVKYDQCTLTYCNSLYVLLEGQKDSMSTEEYVRMTHYSGKPMTLLIQTWKVHHHYASL